MTIYHILTYSYENGGTSKFVADLASFQREKGDIVKILSTNLAGHTTYPVPEGVELISFEPETLTKVIPLYSSALSDYVVAHEKEVDVIHLHCLWNFGELLVDKLNLHHKTVVTIHGSLHPYTFKGLVYYKRLVYSKWFQKNFLRKVKLIHVNHNGEVKDVTDYLGYKPDNMEVIPNGTDLQEVKVTPPADRRRNELLYIGRLHHKKGFEILMPAFKLVLAKRPDAKLLIAGPDDGMLEYIENFCKENGMQEQVQILGTVTGEPKKELFSKSGIFVLPTYSEGFSLAVLEALMYGLPAVVSDQTGLSPLLEDYNAAVVADLTPEAYAKGLLDVLNKDELYNALPENGLRLLREKLEKNQVCTVFNRQVYDKFRS
ncbi:glycosyl transferase group 1 [Leadbetterella byssophila DSM 17132]|uniref:Glycosyl transferase group 1 n=1 Tax=Leadbetterella byssophila (strain DSM 17132 / JCM 16389 / KACC 11308 / NBRC 106382 / 4M15) TaxID=649349 RepID=E4RZP9_LEAB4|nr:glycosyltransferase [Leadbetterella byssophila]ADQ18292.1 glycosyl transferase group 1 [Leadbetterella byssophila DSM 17132]